MSCDPPHLEPYPDSSTAVGWNPASNSEGRGDVSDCGAHSPKIQARDGTIVLHYVLRVSLSQGVDVDLSCPSSHYVIVYRISSARVWLISLPFSQHSWPSPCLDPRDIVVCLPQFRISVATDLSVALQSGTFPAENVCAPDSSRQRGFSVSRRCELENTLLIVERLDGARR